MSPGPTTAGLPPNADDSSYTLKFELAPSVIEGATLISATLDIDRFVDGKFIRRMTYPLIFDATKEALRTTGVLRTTGGFGDGESLRGCRARDQFRLGERWNPDVGPESRRHRSGTVPA